MKLLDLGPAIIAEAHYQDLLREAEHERVLAQLRRAPRTEALLQRATAVNLKESEQHAYAS